MAGVAGVGALQSLPPVSQSHGSHVHCSHYHLLSGAVQTAGGQVREGGKEDKRWRLNNCLAGGIDWLMVKR